MNTIRVFLVAILVNTYLTTVPAQSVLEPLSKEEIREAKAAIKAMKENPRGPYRRLRWFCADGTIHPPSGTPCSRRGGGVQHAELGESAKRLTSLHFNVGAILQSLSFEQFLDPLQDNHQLKELILQDYLFHRDDGWVLRRARYYRGARQIEDEERQGQSFLVQLLSDPAWIGKNFLVATQLVATVPHVTAVSHSSRNIRSLASELAELDPRFMQLRTKIHSFPSREDLEKVNSYLAAGDLPDPVREKLALLKDELSSQGDPERFLQSLTWYQIRIGPFLEKDFVGLKESLQEQDLKAAFSQIAEMSLKLHDYVTENAGGAMNLLLLGLNQLLQEKSLLLVQELEPLDTPPISRQQRIQSLSPYFALAASSGFLSRRELEALEGEISWLQSRTSLSALEYKKALNYLGRSLNWARSTSRQFFGPLYERYSQVEPQTSGFLDNLVRGSILLSLSIRLDYLHRDADNLLNQSDFILGEKQNRGVRGLNPGIATGSLAIVEQIPDDWNPDPTKIYVIPETMPELKPVAGIMTLDAGNLLSHVQLLARSLQIPNASISPSLLPRLKAFGGRQVFFAVSPLGLVVLKEAFQLTPAERQLSGQDDVVQTTKIKIDPSNIRLERVAPLPLHDFPASDTGEVGPKAANLAQLARFFPERVPPGIALPFGMYYLHVSQKLSSGRTLQEEILRAYGKADAMRRAGQSERVIDTFMLAELARFRRLILELAWVADSRRAVIDAIRRTFGPDLSKGVFIRSDTNVEDLPNFSGAGLNLTVPHRRTVESVLESIKRVWTSPFSERAYLWRKQILDDQGQVYPSVLLLQSVPSEKSGVLITSGLEMGNPDDITIATSEGVGGAVGGETSETLLVASDGSVRLLSQAKSPYRKALLNQGIGGLTLLPVSRADYLLSPQEVRRLQLLVVQLEQKLGSRHTSGIWDIEFGFAKGKLWLFQIRPFVPPRDAELMERLGVLDKEVLGRGSHLVSLQKPI